MPPRADPAAVAAAILCLAFAPAALGGYAEGVAAYGAGRHDVAAREFLAAAQAGDVESAYMLGRLYAMGSGVPQDWAQAWIWHDRAARQGHDEAAASRESLETIMAPDLLARVRGVSGSPTVIAQRPPSVEAYDTGAHDPVGPGPVTPQVPVAGERVAVFVPRQGAVVGVPAPAASPPKVPADGADFEGMLAVTGGMAEQARLVQRRLNREGYWAGPVDGRVGPLTRQAIRQYQRDQGVPVTGRVTPDLVTRLGAGPPPVVVRVDLPAQAAAAR